MTAKAADTSLGGTGTALIAFGLAIDCDWLLSDVLRAGPSAAGDLPRTSVQRLDSEQFEALASAPREALMCRPTSGGPTTFRVDLTEQNFVVQLEGWGRYLCSTDGKVISCEQDGAELHAQERFVVAQMLPLAAVLQGLEVLHASAVASERGAAAFLGPSGVGKTTIVGHLVLAGESFFTDDVLAIEPSAPFPQAHSGPPFMAVRRADRDLIDSAEGRLGDGRLTTDKIHARPPGSPSSVPLRAVYHLRAGSSFAVDELVSGDVRLLLESNFAGYLASPERLRRHLTLMSQIDASVPQFRLQMPRDESFSAGLETLRDHLKERIH